MCNAWNHPLGCTCGWGGVGHKGRRGDGSQYRAPHSSHYPGIPPILPAIESYVNPNAQCPKCHDPVFFYQSPFGGRVFFDELGPPWPKHPCTDNSSIPEILSKTPTTSRELGSRIYAWQRDGWSAFFISLFESTEKGVVKAFGIFKKSKITLYLKTHLYRGETDPQERYPPPLACLKQDGNGEYFLSLRFGDGSRGEFHGLHFLTGTRRIGEGVALKGVVSLTGSRVRKRHPSLVRSTRRSRKKRPSRRTE
jgi:hypothetical protein